MRPSLIADANCCSELVEEPIGEDAKPLLEWLQSGKGRIALGGKNRDELVKNARVAGWLVELRRAGHAFLTTSSLIEKEQKVVEPKCRSNDSHIVALARASGARVLFSRDKLLHADFTNGSLISAPRGNVYQKAEHSHLLK